MIANALGLLSEKFPTFDPEKVGLSFIQQGRFTWVNYQVVEQLKYNEINEFLSLHPFMLSPEYQPNGALSSTAAMMKIKTAEILGETDFYWQHQTQDRSAHNCHIHLFSLREYKNFTDEVFTVWQFK